jgi:hypothetical protein
MTMQVYDPAQVAALIRIVVSPGTLAQLYALKLVRPLTEAEDLTTALDRLTAMVAARGI